MFEDVRGKEFLIVKGNNQTFVLSFKSIKISQSLIRLIELISG